MPAQSKAQQKFMGMVHALKKGDMKPSDASKDVKDAAKSMSKKDAEDFASTKHKGLPRKIKQEIARRLRDEGKLAGTMVGSYAIPSKAKKRKHGDSDNLGIRKKKGNSGQPDIEEGGSFQRGSHRKPPAPFGGLNHHILNKSSVRKHDDDANFPKKDSGHEDLDEAKVETERYFGKKGIIIMIRDGNKMISAIFKDKKNADKFNRNKPADVKKLIQLAKKTKYPKAIDEGGLPQNWMSGRTSDYHTKLRGKKRNYDDTNFAKMNTGQPDIPEEEKDDEIVNEKFNKVEHLSLLNKALKAMPGSQNQKEIIRQLNVVRKAGGMRPLKETAIEEYGQRLDLSYILDDESILKGTPKPKDAINRESAKKKSEKNYKDWKNTNEGSASAAQRAAIAISKKEKAGKPGYDKEGKSLKKEESKRDYKDEYKKFQSSTKAKKYRAELNKYNRDKGTYGNGDGKDASHKGGKIVGFESASKNRGRKEKSRLKKENVAPNHNDKSAPYGSGYKKVNEVGVFPVTNYIKGIIPQGRLDTNTPENRKKSTKLVKDLRNTLNKFWKQHDIPFKIK